MKIEADRLALHFKYCAFILIMVIIFVATDRWTAQKDFTTYLSNAATMTSLLLGLVAIFYSFVSNDSLSKSLGSIATVSGEIKETKDQIGEYFDSSKDATAESVENTRLLQEASSHMSSTIADLAGTLNLISGQNQALQGLVTKLPTRIEQLELKVGDVAKKLVEKSPQFQSSDSKVSENSLSLKTFFTRPSIYNNLLSYACVLAARENKLLMIDDLCKAVSLNVPAYFNGFLNCMHAVNIVDINSVEGKSRVYEISGVNSDLSAGILNYIYEYIDDAYDDNDKEKDEWKEKIKRVEELFD